MDASSCWVSTSSVAIVSSRAHHCRILTCTWTGSCSLCFCIAWSLSPQLFVSPLLFHRSTKSWGDLRHSTQILASISFDLINFVTNGSRKPVQWTIQGWHFLPAAWWWWGCNLLGPHWTQQNASKRHSNQHTLVVYKIARVLIFFEQISTYFSTYFAVLGVKTSWGASFEGVNSS